MTARLGVVALVSAILVSEPVLSQTVTTGSVAGVVIDASNRPLSKVTVTLKYVAKGISWTTVTDDAGRFRLVNLPPGGFTLTTMRSGYVTTELGAVERDQPGVPVALSAGQRMEDLTIRLWRGGIISGTIRDENGDPISAQVIAYPYRGAGDDRTAVPAGTGSDARGRYRIVNLPPGEYLVAVAGSVMYELRGLDAAGRAVTLGRVSRFYPGVTASANATPVTVTEDRESGGIDMTYPLMPVTKLTVWVSAADRTLKKATVEVRSAAEQFSSVHVISGTDPSFVFEQLGDGRYRVLASGVGEDGVSLWATADVTVDGMNPVEIPLVLGPGASVVGQVRWMGSVLTPATVNVQLIPVGPQGGSASKAQLAPAPDPVGFKMSGVRPGRYTFGVLELPNSPPGWTLASATVRGQDVLDLPFDLTANSQLNGVELTLSDRMSELTGSLTDGNGRARTDITLIAFAVDPRYWWKGSRRVQTTRPDTAGHYTIRGLPAGDYVIAAAAGLGASGPYDPVLLTELAKTGVRESLAQGEKRTRDLRFAR